MTRMERISQSDTAINANVKIAGTNWDRRRKLTNKQIGQIKKAAQRPGFDIKAVAKKYGVAPLTIRYHIDEQYKREINTRRADYPNYTSATYEPSELAAYKRELIMAGKKLSYEF